MTQADITLLKKQIADETAEKYALIKRVKELNEEIAVLKDEAVGSPLNDYKDNVLQSKRLTDL
jgi:cell division protein FtsB|tara:strand:+ start:806 stop:994 length:189 start_codon:yes stop_codon:yes gene_type:complete